MIDWDNFGINNKEDNEDEGNKETRIGTINWDTFNPNGSSSINSENSIDWDNMNTSKNVFEGMDGFTTNRSEIKSQINDIISKNEDDISSNNVDNEDNKNIGLTITTYQNENEALSGNRKKIKLSEERKAKVQSISNKASDFKTNNTTKKTNTSNKDKHNINQNVPQVNDVNAKEKYNRTAEPLIKPITRTTKNKGNNSEDIIKQDNNLDASEMYIMQKLHSNWNEEYGEYVTDNSNILDLRNNTQKNLDAIKGFTGNLLEGADSFIPNVVNYIYSAEKYLAKGGMQGALKFLGYNDEDINKIVPIAMNKYQNLSPIGQLNSLLNSEIAKKQREENIRINNIRASNTNPLVEKLTELAPSLGDNIVSYGLTAINPVLGTASFMLSAGGSYLDDAKSRGMNDEQAFAYASVMGAFEGGTESIISGNFIDKVGRKLIGKGLSKEVLNSFGVSSAENFFQEAVMEPLQEATAMVIGGPETANWEDIWKRFFESGVDGIISSIILGGASVGIASAEKVLGNNQASSEQYNQAIVDTINSGKVDVNSIVEGAKQAIIDSKDNLKLFYTSTFNQDGTVESIKTTIGKEIKNPNNQINITPVIVKNENNSYNIIDKNTGILLDSTPYETIIGAQAEFTDKITKLDEASINSINQKTSQARLSIEMEKINIIQNDNEILLDNKNVEDTSNIGTNNVMDTVESDMNNVNENHYVDSNNRINNKTNVNNSNANVSQTVQDKFSDNENLYNTNYIPNNNESLIMENNAFSKNGLNEVSKLVSQISDTSLYNREQTSAIFRNVTRNIPNVELQVNENSTYLNSLDRNGNIVYQQQIANRSYVGAEIREVVNNAIYNADLSNVNTSQASKNGFRDVSDNETTNYMPESQNGDMGQNNRATGARLQLPRSSNSTTKTNGSISNNSITQNISTGNNYKNATDLIKGEQEKAEQNFNTDIYIRKINELDNINFQKMSENEYIKLSKSIFKANFNNRVFKNSNSNINIKVILEDIKESAYKAYNNKFQNKFLKEHVQALSQLDKIISNGNEVSIDIENKNRKQYKSWRYFTTQVLIENRPFLIEFDVTEKSDGYHFRLQRLVELNINNKRATTSAMTKTSRC